MLKNNKIHKIKPHFYCNMAIFVCGAFDLKSNAFRGLLCNGYKVSAEMCCASLCLPHSTPLTVLYCTLKNSLVNVMWIIDFNAKVKKNQGSEGKQENIFMVLRVSKYL